MLKAGIVGLPNVGKSTLFNAITKQQAVAANYPFATIEPNVGIVLVKDDRLEKIEEIYKSNRKIYTAYQFIDIAGLVKGASKGEGLGNQFLSHIREVDAICQVVRLFEDDNIIHVEGSVDPIRDIETIWTELSISDLDTINKRLFRIEKSVKANLKEAIVEYDVLTKIKISLDNLKRFDLKSLNEEETKILKGFNLLTLKPMIIIVNVSEDDLFNLDSNLKYQEILKYGQHENIEIVPLSIQLEMEIANLSDSDQKEFLQSYNLERSGLDEVILRSYELLGLETYFTAGEQEARAWTFEKGMKAPECAGIIHSDFERGFIKAETLSYSDLIKYETPLKAKEAGRVRMEGKDYLVKDGDIILFRFNV